MGVGNNLTRAPGNTKAIAREAALWAAIVGLLAWLYLWNGNAEEVHAHGRSAWKWLTSRWGVGGNVSHGWLIIVVSAGLVVRLWFRRELPFAEARPSAWGLAIIGAAMGLYFLGIMAQQTRVTLVSWILLLWGIPLYRYGWPMGRRLAFPVAYLFFALPFGFLDALTFPLRLVVSAVAAAVLNGLGIPAARAGTAIYSNAGKGFNLEVADPCSGLHSLLALAALAALYAYLTETKAWRQWALFVSCVPIAMAGNAVRILTIAIVARFWGQELAVRYYHDYSGYVFFTVSFLFLMGTGRLLNVVQKTRIVPWRPSVIAGPS